MRFLISNFRFMKLEAAKGGHCTSGKNNFLLMSRRVCQKKGHIFKGRNENNALV
jgi:hypothetical protein